jgi:hypothetical protein
MLKSGDRGNAYAVVLTFTAAVLTLAVTAFGVPWQAAGDSHAALVAAARGLASDIAVREADQLQKFLAETGRPKPANIEFMQPELIHWRTDGGAQRGSLKQIEKFYADLEHGRLVILGDAGTGKTVLATQLVLDLITALPTDDPSPGHPLKVPLRISLPSFDPPIDPYHSQPDQVAADLRGWIIDYLVDVHGLRPRTAQSLLNQGWILPVLDGLDEMDVGGRNPVRATAVIRAWNYPMIEALPPVIITCRTDRYHQLVAGQTGVGYRAVLQDATVVVIQFLTAAQIAEYLLYRFPDPADKNRIQYRWRPVINYITKHENSGLVTALRSPLMLFLAITAFANVTTNPSTLIQLTDADLEPFLFSQLIPATTYLHRMADGRAYDPSYVTHWLATLAKQVEAHQEHDNQIELTSLWTTVRNPSKLRYYAAILSSVPFLLFLSLSVSSYVHFSAQWSASVLASVLVVIGCGILVISVFWRASRPRGVPYRLDISRLRNRDGWHAVAAGSAIGMLIGLPFGFALGVVPYLLTATPVAGAYLFTPSLIGWYPILDIGLRFGLAIALGFGLAVGAVVGLRRQPTAIRRPGQLVSQGVIHDIVALLLATLVPGISLGLVFVVSDKLVINALIQPVYFQGGFGSGFLSGSLIGITGALFFNSSSPWLRYFVATDILAKREHSLPPRPAAFMDWAYAAGLVRLSGIFAEFRHSQLQAYLCAYGGPSVGVPQS